MIWLTRTKPLESLSAFALEDNAIYYRIMHISASLFFILGGRINRMDYYLSFGMALILAFDMYHFPVIHNTVTALTLLLACTSLVYYSKGFERSLMIFLSGTAIGIFVIGYFFSLHLLAAEIIAMGCIMCGKLRENWAKHNLI